MKRLLVLASTFPREIGDGTPGFVLDLALEEAKNFEVRVLAPMVPGARRREEFGTASGTPITVIRYRYVWPFRHSLADGGIIDNLKARPLLALQVPFLVLGLWRALLGQALSWRPHAIHAHWIIPQGLVARLATPWLPLLVSTHGGDVYALNGRFAVMLKRFVLRGARAVTAVNMQAHDRLVGWGAKPQTLTVLPMGVDLAGAHMAGLGARRRKYRIVFVGRLVEKKGVEYLIEAIRQGLAKGTPRDLRLNPATTAIIIGDGPLRAELEAQAKDLPIEFRGQQNQLEVLRDLAKATVAAIPSVTALSGDQEGLPVTLLEAAAAGAFIVASDLPGINEVVVDGETGLLVPPRDATALLRALRTGLERVVFRESCVTLMSSAVKQFDRAAVGARYTRIINQQVLRG